MEARQPHPQPQRGVAEALSEPNASLGRRCTRSMGVGHPKPSLVLQSFIQEWAAARIISIAKCYGIYFFKESVCEHGVSVLFYFILFFRCIRVKYVIERILQSIVLGPS